MYKPPESCIICFVRFAKRTSWTLVPIFIEFNKCSYGSLLVVSWIVHLIQCVFLQIYKQGQPSHFVNAYEETMSNWMRYVNCARSESEQNLVAFQHKGEIYYRSFKDIPPGTELLVWYGHDYGKELGIHREDIQIISKFINGEG